MIPLGFFFALAKGFSFWLGFQGEQVYRNK